MGREQAGVRVLSQIKSDFPKATIRLVGNLGDSLFPLPCAASRSAWVEGLGGESIPEMWLKPSKEGNRMESECDSRFQGGP